jgi:hypothetical protein
MQYWRIVAVFVIFFALMSVTHGVDHPDDVSALTALFNATSGASWTRNSGWNGFINQPQNYSVCSAYGITCSVMSGQMRVRYVVLTQNNLQGQHYLIQLILSQFSDCVSNFL